MEPRIQYATTDDGVNIAFWAIGEGMPFVHMPWFRSSHIQREWQIPEYRRWYDSLAKELCLVRYDGRGIGMSDRNVEEYSLDALVADLEAVVDRLQLKTVALFGVLHMGPVAIAYAARHPERVSHLILWCTYARSGDYARSSQVQATRGFMDKDWELYTQTLAHVRLGWSEGPSAQQFAALIRESITPQALQALIEAYEDLDVSALLPKVKAPTLVLHRAGLEWLRLDVAKELAARIPGASLTLLDGASGAPFLGDSASVLRAIDRFLGLETDARLAQPERVAGTLVTILFTDIVGSTALTRRLGDEGARAVLREHERIVRGALAAHGGSEVKATGDGFMASFGSARQALECAIAVQKSFAERDAARGPANGVPLQVRIGLNAGEPVAENGDLFGTAVNVAARIADQAQGGEILASNVVRELTAGKGFGFSDRGEQVLRGFEDPMHIYAVTWRGGDG
ncbi:MAG: adenylate/guanylate cyclase domain-containing protein [Chloroflexi bacterium]|nr:MAG: adenylate/guanylate cyclase domain-containing protein [Chloroflexota bacterium]